jgi:phage repressor protein C with HTH and peptisase S24 domain
MLLNSVTKRFNHIVKILEEKNLIKSRSNLAEILDTHRQSLNEIFNEKRNVTVELITKICEEFKVNASYIIEGTLPYFQSIEQMKTNISSVPTNAHAGYGQQIHNPVFESEFIRFQIPGKNFSEGDFRCFEVEGDSMKPSYITKDQVICSFLPSVYYEQALKNYKSYVVITKESIFLKRVVNHVKTSKKITLVSDNLSYDSFDIDVKDILEIWKVEGVITKREIPYPHS